MIGREIFSDNLALNPVPQVSWENLGLNYFRQGVRRGNRRRGNRRRGNTRRGNRRSCSSQHNLELQGLRGAGVVLLPSPPGSPLIPSDPGAAGREEPGSFPWYSPGRWCSVRCLFQREPPQVNTTALMKSLPQSLTVFPSPLPSPARSSRTRQLRTSTVPFMLPTWCFSPRPEGMEWGILLEYSHFYTDGLSTPLSYSSL